MTNKNQVVMMAERLSVEPSELHAIVMQTLMPGNKTPTEAQFVSFLAVANEYGLNPITKEIYAFPAKGGGLQPIVSIDGWLKIINSHPDFDGMEFVDNCTADGVLISVTCKMHRKGRSHPTEVTEYMAECKGVSEPWKRWPARMLRHKATIQAARYAFGFSGIIDADEAERYEEAGAIKTVNPTIDEDQKAVIMEAIESSSMTLEDFLKTGEIAAIEELEASRFERSLKFIESKKVIEHE